MAARIAYSVDLRPREPILKLAPCRPPYGVHYPIFSTPMRLPDPSHLPSRLPAAADLFYPGQAQALERELEGFLAHTTTSTLPVPKAMIVPHAGYVYSGQCVAHAYALLAPARRAIQRVILLGPAHRVALRGLALPGASEFITPLGSVAIDANAVAAALSLPQVSEHSLAHAQEHALEVQLPFLQKVLEHFTLVPFAVGAATTEEVAEVLDLLWGGPETLILISSDLSHYHGDAMARELDRGTSVAILALEPHLDHEQACGATPINALLLCARRRGLKPYVLDQRNSADSPTGGGDRARVVGYGAFAFIEGEYGPA